MQAQPVIKRNLLMQLIALFFFLYICVNFAVPISDFAGDTSSTFSVTFVLLVFCRLAWQIYKRTFRFRDYSIYFAITIGLCFLVDYLRVTLSEPR
jgi:hypothetical protein